MNDTKSERWVCERMLGTTGAPCRNPVVLVGIRDDAPPVGYCRSHWRAAGFVHDELHPVKDFLEAQAAASGGTHTVKDFLDMARIKRGMLKGGDMVRVVAWLRVEQVSQMKGVEDDWGTPITVGDLVSINEAESRSYLSHLHTHWNEPGATWDYCTAQHQ